jgi:hypothetical protein
MFIHLHAMSQLRGNMEDGIEAMLPEDTLKERGIPEIALDACKSGKTVFVRLEIDIDDGVTFAEETPLENSAEEARGSGDEIMRHGCSVKPRWAGGPQEVRRPVAHFYFRPQRNGGRSVLV